MMRGLAIVGIVLHNLLRWCPAFFVPENESTFDPALPRRVLNSLLSVDSSWFGNLFSFFGWYGVAVFVFLSGYGLVCRYEGEAEPFSSATFLRRSLSKVYRLFLPAFVLYLVVDLLLSGWPSRGLADLAVTCLLLNDPLFTWFPPDPGVFWYFGLALELYVVYVVLRRFGSIGWAFAAACLLITALANPAVCVTQAVLQWMKSNFVGWLPVFVWGMWWARKSTDAVRVPVWQSSLSGGVSLVLVFAFSFDFYLWLLTPFFAVMATVATVRIMKRSARISSVLTWLGAVSAALFALHPTVRLVFRPIVCMGGPWAWPLTALYLALSVAGAYVWTQVALRCRGRLRFGRL